MNYIIFQGMIISKFYVQYLQADYDAKKITIVTSYQFEETFKTIAEMNDRLIELADQLNINYETLSKIMTDRDETEERTTMD